MALPTPGNGNSSATSLATEGDNVVILAPGRSRLGVGTLVGDYGQCIVLPFLGHKFVIVSDDEDKHGNE